MSYFKTKDRNFNLPPTLLNFWLFFHSKPIELIYFKWISVKLSIWIYFHIKKNFILIESQCKSLEQNKSVSFLIIYFFYIIFSHIFFIVNIYLAFSSILLAFMYIRMIRVGCILPLNKKSRNALSRFIWNILAFLLSRLNAASLIFVESSWSSTELNWLLNGVIFSRKISRCLTKNKSASLDDFFLAYRFTGINQRLNAHWKCFLSQIFKYPLF